MGKRRNLVKKAVGGVAGAAVAAALGISGSAQAIPHVSATLPGQSSSPKPKRHASARPEHKERSRERERAPKHDAQTAEKLKERGDSLQKEGKLDEASKEYARAYEMDPSNIPIVEEYGRTLYGLSRYREAAELFQKAASRSEPAAYWNLGYALRKLHDYEGAAQAYLQYINANPDDPDGFYAVGECYRKLGRMQDAITAYDAYTKKATRPEDQAWVDKARNKSAGLTKALAAAQAQPPVVAAAPGSSGMVVSMATAAPVVEAAPAPAPPPVVVAPPPVVTAPPVVAAPVAAPVATAPVEVVNTAPPVVVAPAPAPAPVVVAAPAPAPAPVIVAAPAPVVVAAPEPAPAPVVTAPPPVAAPAPVVTAPPPAPVVVAPAPPARDTNGALARVRDGDRAFQQKQFSEAIAAYQEAIKLDDQLAVAYLKLGLALANMSRFQDAIDQWQRVIQLDPSNRYAPRYITKAQERLSAQGGAAVATQPLQAATPVAVAAPAPAPAAPAAVEGHAPTEEETASYRRGIQALKDQRYQDSLTELTSVIDRNPAYVNAYVARGRAYAGARNYAAAISDYAKALTLNPNMATPLFGLAQAYERQGSTASACENYRRYLQSSAPDVQPRLKDIAQQAVSRCGP